MSYAVISVITAQKNKHRKLFEITGVFFYLDCGDDNISVYIYIQSYQIGYIMYSFLYTNYNSI